ncbi:hypothetical protein PITCH_A230024 [uncultured Desulfobacterium sp.]|uniref:Uncharacterized protein n=1 Tax=uncultured Desulfobacterium sp. TaxID=201089 RepID=A0A445MXZ3_9BACT|nr:hypothetical protein PITCH_A230024 [uncultured Desulfobacterium sp.]
MSVVFVLHCLFLHLWDLFTGGCRLLVLPVPRCRHRPRGTRPRRGRRPVERFNESLEIEVDGFGKPSRAVARLVVGAGLGSHDAAVDRFAALVARHFQVAEEDQVDHAQHDLAGFVGERRDNADVLAGPRLDFLFLGVGYQDESVWQEGQLGQDTVELVVDQRPALAVAEVGLVFDLELRADVVAAHPVGVVDRIQNDGLVRMFPLGDLAACGE